VCASGIAVAQTGQATKVCLTVDSLTGVDGDCSKVDVCSSDKDCEFGCENEFGAPVVGVVSERPPLDLRTGPEGIVQENDGSMSYSWPS
jgi:hypothetical protein